MGPADEGIGFPSFQLMEVDVHFISYGTEEHLGDAFMFHRRVRHHGDEVAVVDV